MRRILLLIVIPLVVFSPSLFFEYTNTDDTSFIQKQMPTLRDPGYIFSYLAHPFTNIHYRPIMSLIYSFSAILGGGSLVAFHITNITFHIINVLLLYTVLKHLKFSLRVSFWASLFFSVSPAIVPSVVWTPGINELLLMTFFLAAFISFIRKRYILSFICLFLAVLTKESAMIFVFILLLYYVFFLGKKDRLGGTFLFLSWIGLFSVYFSFLLKTPDITGSLASPYELILRFLGNIQYMIPIFGEMVLPLRLSLSRHILDAPNVPGVVSLALFFAFFMLFGVRDKRIFLLGLFILVLPYVPQFFVYTPTQYPELYLISSRNYFPYLGVVFILLSSHFWLHLPRFLSVVKVPLSVLCITLFCLISFATSFRFSNEVSFWSSEALASPASFNTNYYYGRVLFLNKQYREALSYFRKAEEIHPKSMGLPNEMAISYMQTGDNRSALSYLEKALRLNPKDTDLRLRTAILYVQLGEIEKARFHLLQVLLFDPNNSAAREILDGLR